LLILVACKSSSPHSGDAGANALCGNGVVDEPKPALPKPAISSARARLLSKSGDTATCTPLERYNRGAWTQNVDRDLGSFDSPFSKGGGSQTNPGFSVRTDSKSLVGWGSFSTAEPLCLGVGLAGIVDEPRVYDHALSADWIAVEYANFARRDQLLSIGPGTQQ